MIASGVYYGLLVLYAALAYDVGNCQHTLMQHDYK